MSCAALAVMAAACLANNAAEDLPDAASQPSAASGSDAPTSVAGPRAPVAAPGAGPGDVNAPATDVNAKSAPVAVIGPAETSAAGDGSATIGPSYLADPNMAAIDGVPQGRWCSFVLRGDDSNFYTGNDPLLSRSYAPIVRNVYVYVPPGDVGGAAAPVLVLHDAQYTRGYLDHVLDNLIAQKALPPLVAVAVDNGGGDSRGSERGLEYDVVDGKFGAFIDQEVLPAAERSCGVRLSRDPALRAAMGLSSGGAAAIGMGYWHPELYGRLITYSATMIAQFPTAAEPNGAWAYPTELFPQAAKKNLRIFLCAGENDLQAGQNNNRDFLLANRTAARVLLDKGYHVQFLYARGAGHTDGRVVQQTLPAALAWAWRGWAQGVP